MLRFFRQLRQKLLTKNRFSKYLLYAVGEILLVVVGILIALSIDTWKSDKLDRISETEYLKRLSADLVRDTLNYSWTMRVSGVKQRALGELLGSLRKDRLVRLDSSTAIQALFSARLLSFAHPKVVTGTYEELKNTGSFRQIESTLLRTAITAYYSSREHQYQRIESKRVEPGFGDEIDKVIPGFRRKDSIVTYRSDLVSFEDIVARISHPEFMEVMTSEYNLAAFMQNIQRNGLEDAKDLLTQINAEIALRDQ